MDNQDDLLLEEDNNESSTDNNINSDNEYKNEESPNSQASNDDMGNGYNSNRIRNNREAYKRGMDNPYRNRLDTAQKEVNNARRNFEASRAKAKNTEGKGFKEKVSDNLGVVKDGVDVLNKKKSLMNEKFNSARSTLFKFTNPGEALKMAAKNKIRDIAIAAAFPAFIWSMGIFVVFVVVLFITGHFEKKDSNNIASNSSGGECGFTLRTTEIENKTQYKEKVCEYSKNVSYAKLFCTHADTIFDRAMASNINPELVIVRAAVEGYSPYKQLGGNGDEGFGNNFWGIGCYNGVAARDCHSYGSFLEGVQAYIDNINKYSNLVNMMTNYAYIGKQWLWKDWDYGGCIYLEYIKGYYSSSPEAQTSKKNAEAACNNGGTGIATTKHDQEAYTSWQINSKMYNARKSIFGLTSEHSLNCDSESSGNIESLENGVFVEGDGKSHGLNNLAHPCPKCSGKTSGYGLRPVPVAGATSWHDAIDLGAPTGTPVLAADGGTVIVAKSGYNGGRGHYIMIDHGNGIKTRYQHLKEKNGILVNVGQKVSKGQVIGKVGNTGASSGPHLDFAIYINGKTVDPEKYITF